MTNKAIDWSNVGNWIEFDGFTFNNLSEVFEYIQGRLDILYKSDFWSEAEKAFQSMVIMRRFNDTVYSHYKESE